MDVFSKHQQHLPPLPLPDLGDTLSRYVATVAPMLTDAQLECTRAAVAASSDATATQESRLAEEEEPSLKRGKRNFRTLRSQIWKKLFPEGPFFVRFPRGVRLPRLYVLVGATR